MHDLKSKVNISTGVLSHKQRLTHDAHGLNPILAADSAPLSSVGLGHGVVIWLGNSFAASPPVSTADSSHRSAKSLNTQDQQDFPTLLESLPGTIAATRIDVPSPGPARAQPAPTRWDSPPPSAASLAATPSAPSGILVPGESLDAMMSPAAQSTAQSLEAGGSRYSPPERIQRALRLAHLHEENRKWHEREAALLAWAHNTQTGPGPLPMNKLRELHSYLIDDSTRALAMLRNTSPFRTHPAPTACPERSRSPRPVQPMVNSELDTLVTGRQRPRHRRPRESPAPPAQCALPGSWNKDFLQELAREVTLAPWLQWNPTSGQG